MSELEPVEPEEAVEYLFSAPAGAPRAAEPVDAEIAQPLDDAEELEEIGVIETAIPIEEFEVPEVKPPQVKPLEIKLPPAPPVSPVPPARKSSASSAAIRPLSAAKPVAPVKPFKHPAPAKSAEVKPVEKYYYITGAQLVTMMITLPLMSAAISMGSMYLGHVITEESRTASQVLARIPRMEFTVPAPVKAPPAARPEPLKPSAPAVDLTSKPDLPEVVAIPASAIEQTTLSAALPESTMTAVLAVQAPVKANDNRFSAEVVPDSALEQLTQESATAAAQAASPTPAEAHKAPPRALVPVTGRSASYLLPVDDAYYLLNATARDEAETVVPMAPPETSTRAVEVDMPVATFEAPDAPQHYAEVMTPPAETASAPKPPVTVTVVEVKPEPIVPPASTQIVAPAAPVTPAEPMDETMRGELLPRSDAEIAREKADDARRVKVKR